MEKISSQKEESRKLLEQYDKDRRSTFVGNLQPGTTENDVINLARTCGQVASVQVLNKPVSGANSKMPLSLQVSGTHTIPGLVNCFAFVEFVRPDSTDKMICTFVSEMSFYQKPT